MTAASLLVFAGIYFVAVATPGPGVVLVISRSLGRGLSGLPWFIAGFVVGDIVLMTVAVSGLAFIANTFEEVFRVVRWAGAAYLMWMAYRIWTAPVSTVDVQADAQRERPMRAFLSSLSLTLGNPKAITFFLSLMPLALDLKTIGLSEYVIIAGVMTVIIGPILTAFALLAHRARLVFRSERALKRLNRGSATVMAGAAVAIATQ